MGTNQAAVAASQFNALRERDGRISSIPMTDANLGEVADVDPFTAIGERLEKNAVRAAIELVPDAQQR